MTGSTPVSGRIRIPRPGRVLELARTRLRRPRIDVRTAETILDRYGLRLSGSVANLPFGWRHRSVVLPTPAGRKVLKRYRDGWSEGAIEHEHSILRHLEAEGYPAVRVEQDRVGRTVVADDLGHVALFGFESGVNLTGFLLPRRRSDRLWREAGTVLAGFHAAVAGFVPNGRHHLGFDGTSEGRRRDLAWHRDVIERLTHVPPPADPTAAANVRSLVGDAHRIVERIAELEQRLAAVGLTRSVIHGDPGIHNLLVRRDGTAVLTDFELSRIEWRLIDIAIVLSRTDERAGRAFIDGYDAALPDRLGEREHLLDVWEHYRLCGAVQSWATFARLGDPRRLATARSRVEEADQIAVRGHDAVAALR